MDGNFADDLKMDLPARECNSTILFNNIELENDWLSLNNYVEKMDPPPSTFHKTPAT